MLSAKDEQNLGLSEERLTSKETIQKLLPFFKETRVDISDFEPIRIVGEGAYATVYKCKQISSQEIVAVKVLKPHMVSSERDVYDFLMEAQLLHKLRHKAIVKFKGICYGKLDAKYGSESICVATEFMESGSLKDSIRANGRRPERPMYSKREGLQWMVQIAEGLEYLHRRRFAVIHRDLKPENILLCPMPGHPNLFSAKIADFGLSAMVTRKRDEHSNRAPPRELDGMDSDALPELLKHGAQRTPKTAESLEIALTGLSRLLRPELSEFVDRADSYFVSKPHCLTGKKGSLLYMAPEVLRSEMSNEKVDVFSFGTVLYETLQGKRIAERFGAKFTVIEVEKFAHSVRDGFRLPIPEDWPEELRDLVAQCWKDDPKERPSMRKVAISLSSMYEGGMFSNRPVKKKHKKHFSLSCLTKLLNI